MTEKTTAELDDIEYWNMVKKIAKMQHGLEGLDLQEQMALAKKKLEKEKEAGKEQKVPFQTLTTDYLDKLQAKASSTTEKLLGLKLNAFKEMESATEGIQKGFYIIGADPNIGKTATLISLALDVLKSNDDVFCLFISADDPADDILHKMTACNTQIANINDLKKMGYYKKIGDAKTFGNCEKAYAGMKKWAGKMAVYGDEIISSYEELENAIDHHQKENKDKQVVVFIDSLKNIKVPSQGDIRLDNEFRASQARSIANMKQVPFIATLELKRKDGSTTPTMDDLKETTKYAYEAWFIAMLSQKTDMPDTKDSKTGYINFGIVKNKFTNIKKDVTLEFVKPHSHVKELNKVPKGKNDDGIRC